MAKSVGPSGRVSSFEPVAQNFQTLCENVAMNALSNVDVHNQALSNCEGSISLIVPAHQDLSWTPSASGYAVGSDNIIVEAPAVRLDAFLSRATRRLSFIKIDVEGAELDVLEGAVQTLRDVRPIVFVEIHGPDTAPGREVVRLLRSLEYDVSIIGERGLEAFCLALPLSVTQGKPSGSFRA